MPVHTNRLAREKSPYLLQHQHNPVDWYAWGEAAFARARAEDKPVFLSIGYSTCHWCHVMERESFESGEVAAFLNAHFVAIKVDREERPDVDKIYMTFVQATSGQGGWPLNVFLAPDLKPFFGGTYFPPDGRGGRPGFLQLLRQIERLWATRRGDVEASSTDIHERLAAFARGDGGGGSDLAAARLESAARVFKAEYDSRQGGFGGAPKFPRPTQPAFVLRHGVRAGDAEAVRMVLHTCDAMAAGGMYDQLGGGFHRYSVDAEWRVPHFEKMLYDNAQLVQLYLDAHLVSGEARHAAVAADILRYVLRDMTHPEGGFYSAEDADSEGHEGKFYCWTRAELASVLAPDEFGLVCRYYGITEAGNFVDHSHPSPLTGQNVLCVVQPDLSAAEAATLAAARATLLRVRSGRVRPHCDDKILASWNGLMLGAMARAGRVLDDPAWLVAAERNLEFLKARLWDAGARRLHHRWRDGERDAVQLLDAYAFLLSGVLELYQATLEARHLEFGLVLADAMIERFHDGTAGGFYQSGGTADLILRLKEDYDGAEPSGNSVAVQALLRLAALTDRPEYRQVAERTLRWFAPRFEHLPQAVPNLLLALGYWLEEPRRVVLTGDPKGAAWSELLGAAHRVYQPNKVILGQAGPVERFAASLPAGPEPRAYVCTGTACQPPTSDPAVLRGLLR